MPDPRRIAANLMNKTVANGCAPAEAHAAQVQLDTLVKRHGLDLDSIKAERERELTLALRKAQLAQQREVAKGLGIELGNDIEVARWYAQWREDLALGKRHMWPAAPDRDSVRRILRDFSDNYRGSNAYWDERAQQAKTHHESVKTPPRKKAWEKPEPPRSSVGDCAEWYLMNHDWDYGTLAELVRERMMSDTTSKSMAWYANKLRKEGYDVPKRRR